jgi:hypothetical protein
MVYVWMSRIWDRHEEARWRGARDNAPERLFTLLADPAPEVGLSLSSGAEISGYRTASPRIIFRAVPMVVLLGVILCNWGIYVAIKRILWKNATH